MEKKRALVILVCIIAMASLSQPIRTAEGEESFSIITEKTVYYEDETVHVYVKADSLEPDGNITITYVNVTDASNTLIAEWNDLAIVLTDTVNLQYVGSFVLEQPGDYTIYAEAYGCPIFLIVWLIIRCILRLVIPEVPIGTIAVVVPMLLVLLVKIAFKRREV